MAKKKKRPFDIHMGRSLIPPERHDADKRREWGLPKEVDRLGD